MKLSISRAPARAAVLAAITARTFVTMTVDAPPTHNGAYLCPLIAAALALPWLLCVRALNRRMDARAVTALSAALPTEPFWTSIRSVATGPKQATVGSARITR